MQGTEEVVCLSVEAGSDAPETSVPRSETSVPRSETLEFVEASFDGVAYLVGLEVIGDGMLCVWECTG